MSLVGKLLGVAATAGGTALGGPVGGVIAGQTVNLADSLITQNQEEVNPIKTEITHGQRFAQSNDQIGYMVDGKGADVSSFTRTKHEILQPDRGKQTEQFIAQAGQTIIPALLGGMALGYNDQEKNQKQ